MNNIKFNLIKKMNIYTFRILMKHSMILDKMNDPTNEIWTYFNITEIGPPNRPDLYQLRIIKQKLSDIPHNIVTHNWWSDMSE